DPVCHRHVSQSPRRLDRQEARDRHDARSPQSANESGSTFYTVVAALGLDAVDAKLGTRSSVFSSSVALLIWNAGPLHLNPTVVLRLLIAASLASAPAAAAGLG